MKYFTLLISLLVVYTAQAQIKLTDKDLPEKDKVYRIYQAQKAWLIGDTLDFGKGGAKGLYNLDNAGALGRDTVYRVFRDKSTNAYGNKHPMANWTMDPQVEVDSSRLPISFTPSDYPQAGDTYYYTEVEVNNDSMGNLSNWIWRGWGANNIFDFRYALNSYGSSNGDTVSYIDPKQTPWGGSYPTATAAKRDQIRVIGSDTVITVYSYYQAQDSNFVAYGVGGSADKGWVFTGTPNGKKESLTSAIQDPKPVHSEKLRLGFTWTDSSLWGVNIIDGVYRLAHIELEASANRVNATGVLRLPNDSFEVVQIQRRRTVGTVDNIFVNGNQVQSTTDTTTINEVIFMAKGYGEPILKIAYDSFGAITKCSYLNVPNLVAFGPIKVDTLSMLYPYFKRETGKISMTGFTMLRDTATMGRPSGVLEPIHVSYDKPQLMATADMVYGFVNSDQIKWSVTMPLFGQFDIKIENTEDKTIAVDGYGILLINGDSAEALRAQVINRTISKQTILFNGFPFQTMYDTSFSYALEYYGLEAQMPLARADFDTADFELAYNLEYVELPDLPIGLDNPSVSGEISLYPNPASHLVYLVAASASKNQVQIVDMTGRMVYQNAFAGNLSLDVADWQSGIYVVINTDLNSGKVNTLRLSVE
ncbi:MAG: T9SS type A sorting domain-containing protein [Bacteroidetes bacterium]|nr:T9SS type A sorting domain-containing protein [Bacteroidota bacterium]